MKERHVPITEISDNLSAILSDNTLPALPDTLGGTGKTNPSSLRQMRHFTEAARKAILAEIQEGRLTMTQATIEYAVSSATLYRWRYRYEQIQPKKIQLMDIKDLVVERQAYEKRIAELENIIGKQTVKIDYLEKALSFAVGEEECQKKKLDNKPSTGL